MKNLLSVAVVSCLSLTACKNNQASKVKDEGDADSSAATSAAATGTGECAAQLTADMNDITAQLAAQPQSVLDSMKNLSAQDFDRLSNTDPASDPRALALSLFLAAESLQAQNGACPTPGGAADAATSTGVATADPNQDQGAALKLTDGMIGPNSSISVKATETIGNVVAGAPTTSHNMAQDSPVMRYTFGWFGSTYFHYWSGAVGMPSLSTTTYTSSVPHSFPAGDYPAQTRCRSYSFKGQKKWDCQLEVRAGGQKWEIRSLDWELLNDPNVTKERLNSILAGYLFVQ